MSQRVATRGVQQCPLVVIHGNFGAFEMKVGTYSNSGLSR